MSKAMKLSDITESLPLIKDFVARLVKTSKQAAPIVEVERTRRVSGASAKPVHIAMEEGQTLKLYIRIADGQPDIFRIDINGKQEPTIGDFDNSYKPSFNASVDMIAQTIKNGQAAFTAKQAKVKVKPIRKGPPPKNKAQQLNSLKEEIEELDKQIEIKETEKAQLQDKLSEVLEKKG